MGTKERIVEEALNLFSIKGFHGTSVKNIADAVGIKDSSLYKHYKSKQEIFDTIVKKIWEHIENMSESMGIPKEEDFEKVMEYYGELSESGIVSLSEKIFLFYLKDEFISKFWRMANIEQYNNPEIYGIFRHIFQEESINYQTKLFESLIKKGFFVEADARVVAMNFYSPIYFLLCKYSGQEFDESEAIDILDKQVKEFYRIYRKPCINL